MLGIDDNVGNDRTHWRVDLHKRRIISPCILKIIQNHKLPPADKIVFMYFGGFSFYLQNFLLLSWDFEFII